MNKQMNNLKNLKDYYNNNFKDQNLEYLIVNYKVKTVDNKINIKNLKNIIDSHEFYSIFT